MRRVPVSSCRALAVVAGLVLSGALPCEAQNLWTVAGPDGGEVRALLVTAPGEVVAGAFGAGLFRTTNAGTGWSAFELGCDSNATSLTRGDFGVYWGTTGGGVCRQGGSRVGAVVNADIRAVAIAGSHLWAGTAGGLYYISDIAGPSSSWTSTGVTAPVWALLVDQARSRIYVGASDGVYEADLSGIGTPVGFFTRVNGPQSGRALAMDDDFVYSVQDAIHGCQVYRRPVVSGTWTAAEGSACAVSMTAGANGELFAAGSGSVRRSTDQGDSFQTVTTGLPSTEVYSVASDGPEAVYLGTYAGVFKTTNGGTTWARTNSGLFATWIRSMARDATANRLFAAAFGSGVGRSDDHGASWTYVNSGLSSLHVTAVAVHEGQIFAATSGSGAFRSGDGGATWTPSSTGLGNGYVRALTHAGGTTLFAALDFSANHVYKSTNGATTWFLATTGVTASVNAFAVESAATVYAASEGGGVFKTVDGGTSWSPANAGLGNLFVRSITRTAGGTLFAGTGGGLYRSTNGALSWTQVPLPITTIHAVAVDSGGGIYAGGAFSVWRSGDDGATWANVGPGRWVHAVLAEDGPRRHLYVGIIGGVRTLDAGAPTLTQVSPAGGPAGGGTTVTISGTEFVPSFTTVRFGGIAASSVAVSSGTSLTATTPAGSNGPVDVSVQTGGGVATLQAGFTYATTHVLTVSREGPGSGTVTSSPPGIDCGADCSEGFPQGVVVTLTASAPAGSAFTGWSGACTGTGTCQVTMDGTRSVTATFMGAPTITGVTPSSGPTTGGTVVRVTGTNFVAGTSLTIGGVPATNATITGPTSLTALTPAGTLGGKAVAVSGPAGSASLASAFTHTAPPPHPPTGWTSGGPFGGIVETLVTHPANPDDLVAATNGGGIFRTTDGGLSWSLGGAPFHGGTVFGLVRHPTVPSTLFATGWGWSDLYRSTDGGATWASFGTFPGAVYVTQLVVDPNNATAMFAAAGPDVLRSSDGGVSWAVANAGLPDTGSFVQGLLVDPFTAGTVYAWGWQESAVYKTTNGGTSWAATGLVVPNTFGALDVVADSLTAGVILANTDAGVYRSANGGTSWSLHGSGLPSTGGQNTLRTIRFAAGSATVLHATIGWDDHGLARSTDGGLTWQKVAAGLPIVFVKSLVVPPTGSGRVYVGGDGAGVFRSSDAGLTWGAANGGLRAALINAVAIHPSTPSVVFAGGGGGIRSGGGIWRSSDGGQTWARADSGLGNTNVRALRIEAAGAAIVAGTGIGTYRSTDGGNTWSLDWDGETPPGINALDVESLPDARVWAGTDAGVFLRVNGAWQPMSSGLVDSYVSAIAASPTADDTVYAATFGSPSRVYRRTSLAGGWTEVGQFAQFVGDIVVHPGNPDIAYVGTELDGVYKTVDGGTSWTRLDTLVTTAVTSLSIPAQRPETLIVGTRSGVYRSATGGASWSNALKPTPQTFVEVVVADPNDADRLWVGTYAQGLFAGGPLAPGVTGVNPSQGPTGGGTVITVTGTNFVAGATVTVGGQAATGVNVVDDITLTATTPAATSGVVAVAVTTAGGTGSLASAFRYLGTFTLTASRAGSGAGTVSSAPPGISCGADCSEPYLEGPSVTLSATPAPGSVFVAWSGACAGTGQCIVTMDGTRSVTATFDLSAAPPAITRVAPSSGPTTGGTSITITGTRFEIGAVVSIGGTAAAGVTVVNATTITALVPPGRAGLVPVTVTTGAGSATLPGGYRYDAARLETAGAATRQPALSGDGRYLAFVSSAALVGDDTNELDDVYVRDRVSQVTTRISRGVGDLDADGRSWRPRISADGRFIAFVSDASNLLPGDTNTAADVFLHDRDPDGNGVFDEPSSRTTRRVSVASTGAQANGASAQPDLSADGQWVAFVSAASDLVPGDGNGVDDVFVHHWPSGQTRRVSLASGGAEANGPSRAPSVSRLARLVAFASDATNLVDDDRNDVSDVFLHDRTDNSTVRVSVPTDAEAEASGPSDQPSIDDAGRTVAFQTQAGELTGAPGTWQIVVRVLPADALPATGPPGAAIGQGVVCVRCGLLAIISQTGQGIAGNGDSTAPEASGDGSAVGFESDADDLETGDGNGQPDVFVGRLGDDGAQVVIDRVSVDDSGDEVEAPSRGVALSGDGRAVAFESTGAFTDAPPGDGVQIYLRAVRLLVVRVTPASAAVGAPGTTAAIEGAGLEPGVQVRVGGVSATAVTRESAARATFTLPAGAAAGAVDIEVENPDGELVRVVGAFTYTLRDPVPDTDGDGLPDAWETQFGLDPLSAGGHNGAGGDADGDGVVNELEFARGTHPRGVFVRFLAEGATGQFATRLALLNLGAGPARVLLTAATDDDRRIPQLVTVPARARASVEMGAVPALGSAAFATTVESDQPLVVDRTMSWPGGLFYGAHAETAIPAPATRWYLAEGATQGGFDLFYLLQNPQPVPVPVRIRYLRPSDPPLEKAYTLPPASRTTVWVDHEEFDGLGRALADTDVSAVIESLDGAPIIVERAMYASVPGQFYGAGHESAGITAPSTAWFLAEGATGPYFDLFVLIANPTDTAAEVEATFLLPDGRTVVQRHAVAPNRRFNIWVDYADPLLADTAVSTTISSLNGVPIIVERAMWWPDGGWHEAHNSPGATTTGTLWALAEGEVVPERNQETYLLIANTSEDAATVSVTLWFEDGTSVFRTFGDASTPIPGRSRFNVPVGYYFPESAGRTFGAIVESLGPAPAQIVVERAIYWDAVGQRWAAGTNALATRLR